MVKICVAPNCALNDIPNLKISYFSFPNSKRYPQVYQAWIDAITAIEPNFQPKKKSKICELHFSENDFDESYRMKKVLMPNCYFRVFLKKDAVPKFGEFWKNEEPIERREILRDLLEGASEKVEEGSSTGTKPCEPLLDDCQKVLPTFLNVKLEAQNEELQKSSFSCFTPLPARVCKLCNFSTPLKIDLDKHMQGVHRPIKIQGIKRPPMKGHRVREPKQFACVRCNFKTYSKLILFNHINIEKSHLLEELETKFYKCQYCNYKSSTHSNLKEHLIEKHNFYEEFTIYHCEQCEFTCDKEKNFEKHKKLHIIGKDEFYCDICFTTFIDRKSLEKHKEVKHWRKSYRFFCVFCDYFSGNKKIMVRHLKMKHAKKR